MVRSTRRRPARPVPWTCVALLGCLLVGSWAAQAGRDDDDREGGDRKEEPWLRLGDLLVPLRDALAEPEPERPRRAPDPASREPADPVVPGVPEPASEGARAAPAQDRGGGEVVQAAGGVALAAARHLALLLLVAGGVAAAMVLRRR